MIQRKSLNLLRYGSTITAQRYGGISMPSLLQNVDFTANQRLKSTFRGSIGSSPAYRNKVQKLFYKQTIPQAQQTEKNKKIRSELAHNSRVQAALSQRVSYQNVYNLEHKASTASASDLKSDYHASDSQKRCFHSSRSFFQEAVPNVVNLEEFDEYEKMTKNANGKAVIYFTATWCPPCKMIKPIFHQLATKFTEQDTTDSILFGQVDVDDNGDAAVHGNISSIPAFHFYHNGKCIKKFSGADPNQLEEEISDLVEK